MAVLTVAAAAKIGRCHRSTITTLVRRGTLLGVKSGPLPTSPWIVQHPRNEIRKVVMNSAPKAGFRQTNGEIKVSSQQPQPVSKHTIFIEGFRGWLAIPTEKRSLALKIAELYTAEELRLLTEGS